MREAQRNPGRLSFGGVSCPLVLLPPEIERMAASVLASDGFPRFVWTDTRPEGASYVRVILASVAERQRWREQYEAAVDSVSWLFPSVSMASVTP